MINVKEVITLYMPFPGISSDLAKICHMYICHDKNSERKSMVLCTTMKPAIMFGPHALMHYIEEEADINRNPFTHPTAIDCDKSYEITNVIPRRFLTVSRTEVCDDLFIRIIDELMTDGYEINRIAPYLLPLLNDGIS